MSTTGAWQPDSTNDLRSNVVDLVIRGGILVDGTGSPRRVADIAVNSGRIIGIGEDATNLASTAGRIVDVDGLVVAPGFIDVHTHYDAQALWDPTLSPSPLHGVTTLFAGNCGFSLAPMSADIADYMVRMLARVEGMPLESLRAGVQPTWSTTEEYLQGFDRGLAANAGFMVGHSALRRVVMREESTQRVATDAEIEAMRLLLRQGLAAGAMGFSSTWSKTHSDADGVPVPSRHADVRELLALAAVAGEFQGTSVEFLSEASGGAFAQGDLDIMTDMSVAAGRPLNWNLMAPSAENLDVCRTKLEAGTHASSKGGRVVALVMPSRPSVRVSFASGFVLDSLQGWAPTMVLPIEEKRKVLSDPEQRRRLRELSKLPSTVQRWSDWPTRFIMETFTPQTQQYEGRAVAEIAAAEGKEPFDALLDIALADGLRTTFGDIPKADTTADWEARAEIIRDPRSLIGGSDAGAHLDMLGTFNYATELLAHGVREFGAFSLEEGVKHLTSEPARLYGLRDRGVVAVGSAADLVVLDPDVVASQPLSTLDDLPANGSRIYAGAIGIAHVFVAGTETVTSGEFTGILPGRVLRSGADTVTSAW
jgi:N-acyl-D-aspartate/D-glutamate deacylase